MEAAMSDDLYAHPEGSVFYRKMKHGRPMISHGQGIYLYDKSGKRYLDGSGGPLVVTVGHGRAEIVEAMARQAQAVAYAHAVMFTTEVVEEYAAALAEIVPIAQARSYFLSTGSEVVEAALKLARQIQMARGEAGRYLIICRSLSYHGTTLGSMGVSGRTSLRTPYMGMLQNMPHIRHPYPYRYDAKGENLAERLEETILAYGVENVAGFIAEPISGSSRGAAAPPPGYWPRIREICDRYGVLLIVDEVLTGMGRTGRWWGIDHWEVTPDILVTSKGIAGGYLPFGAVVAHHGHVEEISRNLGDFNHGGTFSHHPVGAAAALATLRIMQRERLVENAATMGAVLGQQLRAALGAHRYVGDIRGCGLFWALEFVQDRETKEPFPAKLGLAWKVRERAFEKGLVAYWSQGCADGKNGDLVIVGPPLIITEDQVEELVAILREAVEEVLAEVERENHLPLKPHPNPAP
jgi:adenosylmethionine-8-amino-7-oxononanoate aminotransferase